MKNTNPIGLFDSGIGGTSIWKEVHALLPNENTIYLADSKNAPYGLKSKEEIISLSCKNTEFLLNKNCKIIVVACTTATTNAIKELFSLGQYWYLIVGTSVLCISTIIFTGLVISNHFIIYSWFQWKRRKLGKIQKDKIYAM